MAGFAKSGGACQTESGGAGPWPGFAWGGRAVLGSPGIVEPFPSGARFTAMSASEHKAPLTASSSGPLTGKIRVPGDKSISHRAVMLGALAVLAFIMGARKA